MRSSARLILATTAAVALQALVSGAGPPVSGDSQTTCRGVHDVTLTPGFSIQTGSGTFVHHNGTVECTGPVNGYKPAGAGTTDAYGDYHGVSCASAVTRDGSANEVFTMDIPSASGVQRVVSHLLVTFTGRPGTHGGLVEGQFTGDHMSGTFEATPLEGDCVSRPLSRVHITFESVLR
jgi:hypothetical protein